LNVGLTKAKTYAAMTQATSELRAPAKQLAPFLMTDTAVGDALYWLRIMKCLVFLLAAVAIPGLYAAEKQYQTGKIVNIQQKTTTRILYYQVDTPITKNEPYYEVSVQVKDTIYVGDYTPVTRPILCPRSGACPRLKSGSGWRSITCF